MNRLYRSVYRIGGAPVLTVLSDSRVSQATVGLQPGTGPAPGEYPPALELYLLGGKTAMRPETGIPEYAKKVLDSGTVEVKSRAGVHYGGWYGKAASVYAPEHGKAVVTVPGLREYHPDFVARSILRPILDRMLLDRGYIPFHAASVAFRGHGCLLVGPAGSGKSTLLRELLACGYGFLSDDRAVVTMHRGVPETLLFPEYLRIGDDRERKRTVRTPFSSDKCVPLRKVVFLERTDGEFRLEMPGPSETAARLLRAWSAYLDDAERETALDRVEFLARNVTSRVVRGWGEVHRRCGLVRFFLNESGD